MKHYYTAQEFNDMYKDSFLTQNKNDDKWGRYVVEELFKTYGDKLNNKVIDIKPSSDKRAVYYDLMLRHQDKTKTAIECKYRYDKTYKTHMCDEIKRQSFIKNLQNGKIQGGHLITCWPDGSIFVTNIFSDTKMHLDTRWQNATTNSVAATDGKKILKTNPYYYPDTVFYYVYLREENEDGSLNWWPIFSTEPININKLEDQFNKMHSIELF